MGSALFTALLSSALVPIPEDASGNLALPAIAFGQMGLYRLEVALLVFYGVLLLITPTFAGLARGRLPIEISTRGAKFAEEADHSVGLTQERIEEMELATTRLADELVKANSELKRLKMPRGDRTQPEVDSAR